MITTTTPPDIATLLANAPTLRTARVKANLGGGMVSQTWLLESELGPVVLRIDGPLVHRIGLDRQAEWDVLGHVFCAGLGPEPLYAEPIGGVLVTRFVTGDHWPATRMHKPSDLQVLGRLLAGLHNLRLPGKRFDPAGIAMQYAQVSGHLQHIRMATEVRSLAEKLFTQGDSWCLCHHDVHAANIIDAGDPVLIDWEYAAVGDPLFDLAVVVRANGLSRVEAGILLDAWSGQGSSHLMERLMAFGHLYDLIAELWTAALTTPAQT